MCTHGIRCEEISPILLSLYTRRRCTRWKLSNQPLLFGSGNCCLHLQSANRHKNTQARTLEIRLKIDDEFLFTKKRFSVFVGRSDFNEKLHKNRARNVLPLLCESTLAALVCCSKYKRSKKITKNVARTHVEAHVTDRSQRETESWTQRTVVVKPTFVLSLLASNSLRYSAAMRSLHY